MTHFLQDILRQPGELQKSLSHAMGPGWSALQRAAAAIREADHVYITGIGSNWHAGMAVQHMFHAHRWPAHLVDASELVHFVELPPKAAIIAISRSGTSIEIVQLLSSAREAGAVVIGLTNTPDSPLAVPPPGLMHGPPHAHKPMNAISKESHARIRATATT